MPYLHDCCKCWSRLFANSLFNSCRQICLNIIPCSLSCLSKMSNGDAPLPAGLASTPLAHPDSAGPAPAISLASANSNGTGRTYGGMNDLTSSGQTNGSSPTDPVPTPASSTGRTPVPTLAPPMTQDNNGTDANGDDKKPDPPAPTPAPAPAPSPVPAPNGSTGDQKEGEEEYSSNLNLRVWANRSSQMGLTSRDEEINIHQAMDLYMPTAQS
ncbi:hypothetical protein QBC47DRAFT_462034 [Echria macrotheca]|uniref:Uncharacterized protein n=1 Tax=Echria macrotheca TaxID=438768 RepID=A0AAJ0B9B1_9PEZI|nr:hypothetical protein QBC47DRAFT_462034 [Echria macrotheca]